VGEEEEKGAEGEDGGRTGVADDEECGGDETRREQESGSGKSASRTTYFGTEEDGSDGVIPAISLPSI
jgi:hypothetical protein